MTVHQLRVVHIMRTPKTLVLVLRNEDSDEGCLHLYFGPRSWRKVAPLVGGRARGYPFLSSAPSASKPWLFELQRSAYTKSFNVQLPPDPSDAGSMAEDNSSNRGLVLAVQLTPLVAQPEARRGTNTQVLQRRLESLVETTRAGCANQCAGCGRHSPACCSPSQRYSC
jgi:hypothetical protein